MLRFGERLPNPFADGETTYWFHVDCAAFRRPETFKPALEAYEEPVEHRPSLLAEASLGEQHPRLSRIAKIEKAASGRARCRQCKELIEKASFRIGLEIFEEGRFNPIGFLHLGCQASYFGELPSTARLQRALDALSDELRAEAIEALGLSD